MLNDFCYFCTGSNTKEIIRCDDICCVFYRHRWGNLEWQDVEKNRIYEMRKRTRLLNSKKARTERSLA